MKNWPKGYLKAEGIFCKRDYDEFTEQDNDEWRDRHRQNVLDQRERFKIAWKAMHDNI